MEQVQAAALLEQRIASLEEDLIAANAKIAEAERVAANIEAVASAQAQVQEVAEGLELAGLEADGSMAPQRARGSGRAALGQDAAELQGRVVAQDLEITALRSQIAAMEGLLDALMTATTSLLEKLTPQVGGERGRN